MLCVGKRMSEGTGKERTVDRNEEISCAICTIHGATFHGFIVADNTHRPTRRIVIPHKITRRAVLISHWCNSLCIQFQLFEQYLSTVAHRFHQCDHPPTSPWLINLSQAAWKHNSLIPPNSPSLETISRSARQYISRCFEPQLVRSY